MKVNFKIQNNIIIVDLNGELDHHMAQLVKQQLNAFLLKKQAKKILFDFKNVTFMDSSGIGMILGRYKELQKINGKVGVVNVTSNIKRIFEMSGLFNIIEFFTDKSEAIEKL
ncbi:MAG TPA: anti-sigma F factor antagonist [Thermoanaerobacterales bacterium]|jgi:stage II sporulation protein AA (anti-sigma F factor antagonist)|nr:anti-sigma F factor antagonist [Thermoanaerobacterales bacterium]